MVFQRCIYLVHLENPTSWFSKTSLFFGLSYPVHNGFGNFHDKDVLSFEL